jgi:hypothetical protein
MGRQVSRIEFLGQGTVAVGRPVRLENVLPPKLQELQQRRLADIDAIKESVTTRLELQAGSITLSDTVAVNQVE